MPKIDEIAAVIEEYAPMELAEEWDNVGTLVDCGGDITAIMTSLDITPEVISEAEQQNCQLIVSHHPVIFNPLRQVRQGDLVFRMIRKRISAICAHTNLDAATGGVNDILAAIFGIVEPVPFARMGRIGQLRAPLSTKELAESCKTRFSAHVRYVDTGRPVERLAVLGGSGGGLVQEAILAGADCLLTGEADHHDALDAAQGGLSLVVAGHFSTEFPVVAVMADRLIKRFPKMKILVSQKNKDPFSYTY